MSQLTTHILNTSMGKPASGVATHLFETANDGGWRKIAEGITNEDGRLPDLLQKNIILVPGIYKLHFDTKAYFDRLNEQTFYPFVEIIFTVNSSEHYHVPLLLNPFGYSTYRGS